MGSVLEIGKLVTASWLYRNWQTCPILIKSYLTVAVALLMFITSMGIFGFLSKAHIEQSIVLSTGVVDQVAILDNKIASEQDKIADIEKQVAQIDTAIDTITSKGQGKSALQAAERQRKARDELIAKKDKFVEAISVLKTERVKLSSEVKKLEAEVGPIKYIAELIYNDAETNLESAVRIVILLLVLVFDPLAVVLLIAANHGLAQRKRLTKGPGVLTIDSEKVFNIK